VFPPIYGQIESLFPNRTQFARHVSIAVHNAESHATKTIANYLTAFDRAETQNLLAEQAIASQWTIRQLSIKAHGSSRKDYRANP
jgi:hypothetical protein